MDSLALIFPGWLRKPAIVVYDLNPFEILHKKGQHSGPDLKYPLMQLDPIFKFLTEQEMRSFQRADWFMLEATSKYFKEQGVEDGLYGEIHEC